MKRIINGKLYNTETARVIAKSETTTDHSDFGYYCKEIYKKRTGEYFLCQYGYVYTCGWKTEIIPLKVQQTKALLETMGESGVIAYTNEFGVEE